MRGLEEEGFRWWDLHEGKAEERLRLTATGEEGVEDGRWG